MIKKLIIAVSILFLFLLTACGQKIPDVIESGNNNITDDTVISGDTVSINESNYGDSITKNSSRDGFKSVYFAFDNYSISSNMQNIISHNVNNAYKSSERIKLEGNCDEFGTDEYNYALGLKRAKAVKDSMALDGLDVGRTVIVSLGESNPVCSSPSDSCYEKNRRVDLYLIK